ncbi:MAG TPA: sulfatase-like hydrolase/transferase [Candidatus Acidoferrum sp.]|jgi:choline-sulfatase|nr:sulfatase-like hydrolase/transferase [Candidatus Acidoferrum sp.]
MTVKVPHLPLICCLAATLHANGLAQTKAQQPDVFLITIDTLRVDHVHCYGYVNIETPALDGLAKDGVRFTRAFTPSPITNTSHATILTGLLPSSHGVTDFAVPLSPAHPTWAELLHQRGYHTAAFIGAVILDSKTLAPGLDRGFDFYDNFPQHSHAKSRWGRVERRGVDVVQHAEAWLTAHPAGPHFVWVHLYDPHDPYEPPAPFSQRYKDHLYDGEIAYADSALAKFITYLKTHSWYANSLIVVVGDHGEGLGEHHENTHGIFLYDSTTHVPLIVKLPVTGGAAAKVRVVDAQVRTTDILPTVLDLVGGSAPQGLDGESMKPSFVGSEMAPRTAFGETDYPLRFGWAPLRSVRTEGFKFIEAPRPELYDLHADAAELDNKYEPWNANVQKFRGILSELRAKTPPPDPSKGVVGQRTIDELKALGYLGRADVGSATNVPEPSLLPDPKDKIEEQNLLHSAMMASEDDREADARESLKKVLQLDPKSPTALLQLGELELKAGDYASAAQHLKGALEVRPDDATAAFYEGQALEKTHDLAGARDALEASLKLMPSQFEARLLLGEVYLALSNANAAEDQFEAALLLQPKSVEAQLGVAKAQLAQGNFNWAVQQLEPLTRSQPGNAEVFELLAQAYTGVGKMVEAQRAASRAKVLRGRK